MKAGLATEMAPPFHLVAHYFIGGAIYYTIVSLLLPFYRDELDLFFLSHDIAALAHLFLLGFVMMMIFGAMYQLIPVVLEIPIFSKDFAYIQFYLLFVGTGIMGTAFSMANLFWLLPYGSLMVYLAMLIFIVNTLLSFRNLKKWTLIGKYIFTSNLFLLVAVSIGFFIALNLIHSFVQVNILPFVQAHMTAALVGYVLMTVMGIALELIPMFSLSHGFKQDYIEKAYYFVTGGTVVTIGAVLMEWGVGIWIGMTLILIAILLFIVQNWVIFKGRVKKKSDAWSRSVQLSFLFLVISLVGIVVMLFGNFSRAPLFVGFSLFFGFFAFLINGHIYKILPFLVWFKKFAPLVGKRKVPMLADMVKQKVADWQFRITTAGTILTLSGVLVGIGELFAFGAIVMAIGAALLIYNMYYTLNFDIES